MTQSPMRPLFLTGNPRSGTTLIEKLLHAHPNVSVGAQPFPTLFFHAKSAFYAHRDLQRRYPLGNLFLEDSYTLSQFYTFLEDHPFTQGEVTTLLQQMEGYSGQLTPGLAQTALADVPAGSTFMQLYRWLLGMLAEHLDATDSTYIGSKEVLCEEYIPFLLEHGVSVIMIVRDPRDVITSTNFGSSQRHMGNTRPILFLLRQWRKSVSFCLAYEEHPHFTYFRYEDLVEEPWPVLDGLTTDLALNPFPRDAFAEGIHDQQGAVWQGNSSFSERSFISAASHGKFKEVLPEPTIAYIEAVTAPELHALGYELLYEQHDPADAITTFTEPRPVTHEAFPADYSVQKQHVQQEIKRLNLLGTTIPVEKQHLWYIFPRTYEKLRAVADV
jgi:hypothetical protein